MLPPHQEGATAAPVFDNDMVLDLSHVVSPPPTRHVAWPTISFHNQLVFFGLNLILIK